MSVANTADVDSTARLGHGTRIWHLAQVREGSCLGSDCVVGRGAYIGAGVRIGNRVKIQNHALIYEPAVIEDGVFVGPAVVLTNDERPRAVTPSGKVKAASDWNRVGVHVLEGASIGARAVCVAPLTIGRWAMVGAGAVVTRDVPDHALVVGVPARPVGWVGRSGRRLIEVSSGAWHCPETGERYIENRGVLKEAERP